MRPLLALLGGFALTLAVFAGGTAFGTFMLAGKSFEDLRPLADAEAVSWTNEPHSVDPTTQSFVRLPSRPAPADPAASIANASYRPDLAGSGVDPTTTASTRAHDAAEEGHPGAAPEIVAAHVEWCANRYRSYRPRDDSYTPYRGGRRPCVSPHSEAIAQALVTQPSQEDDGYREADGVATLEYASNSSGADHVDYCYSRYRSYRPSDNSYQPYGGGQRRQCR